MDNRFTIADHGVEVGAKFAIFEFDDSTKHFLASRTTEPFQRVSPDSDAAYIKEYTVDLSALTPQVAAPHSFGNAKPIAELSGTHIDQACVGSCANGRFEDIEITAKIVKGRKVHKGVRLLVSPASWAVYRQCLVRDRRKLSSTPVASSSIPVAESAIITARSWPPGRYASPPRPAIIRDAWAARTLLFSSAARPPSRGLRFRARSPIRAKCWPKYSIKARRSHAPDDTRSGRPRCR